MGGLGNQMFQYAAGLMLARKYDVPLRMDIMSLLDTSKRYYALTYRKYALDVFQVTGEIAAEKDISRFVVPRIGNKYLYHLKKRISRPNNYYVDETIGSADDFFAIPDEAYLDGYWQNAAYFNAQKSDIRKEFSFREELPDSHKAVRDEMMRCDSVCVHFRKGDYVGHPELDVLDMRYYDSAVSVMLSKAPSSRFFVFSDDISWCKNNFQVSAHGVSFIDLDPGNKAQYDLQLMTCCKHYIIGNSTFAWWGAWLGNHSCKLVVAPKIWHKNQKEACNSIVEKDWVAI